MAKPKAAKTEVKYHVQVFIAGREGVQEEIETSKRESIRKCKRLVGLGGFGSAGRVDLEEEGRKPRLIFQCHKALTREKREYVKTDEL